MGRNRKRMGAGAVIAPPQPQFGIDRAQQPDSPFMDSLGVIRRQELPRGWAAVENNLRKGVETTLPDGTTIRLRPQYGVSNLDVDVEVTKNGNSETYRFPLDSISYIIEPDEQFVRQYYAGTPYARNQTFVDVRPGADWTINFPQVIPQVMAKINAHIKQRQSDATRAAEATQNGERAVNEAYFSIPSQGTMSDDEYVRVLKQLQPPDISLSVADARAIPAQTNRELTARIASYRTQLSDSLIDLRGKSPAVQKAARDAIARGWKRMIKVAGALIAGDMEAKIIGAKVRGRLNPITNRMEERTGGRGVNQNETFPMISATEATKALEANTYQILANFAANTLSAQRVPSSEVNRITTFPKWED